LADVRSKSIIESDWLFIIIIIKHEVYYLRLDLKHGFESLRVTGFDIGVESLYKT
jgi:hypothetical protein